MCSSDLFPSHDKDGMDALSSAFNALPKSELKTQFWAEHGTALKKCAEDAVVIAGEAQNG